VINVFPNQNAVKIANVNGPLPEILDTAEKRLPVVTNELAHYSMASMTKAQKF
jgi:hypothetical protein